MNSTPMLSRRAVLKGLGASLTLPFLPSLKALDPWIPNPSIAPRRFLAITFGNGVHMDDWWMKPRGSSIGEFSFGDALKPLERYSRYLTPMRGMRIFDDTRDEGGSGHMYYFTNILSGAIVKPGTIGCDVSMDQVMAKELGRNTPIPSLHLGTEPVKSGNIFGAPAICGSTISWRGPTTPVSADIYPQQVFDRLFNSEGKQADKSVLDYVLGDLKTVRRDLSARDQQKLDQYAQAVRELEQRIVHSEKQTNSKDDWQPRIREPHIARPGDGLPAHLPEHIAIMNDLLVLALAMDKTRIATFVMAQDVTDRSYGFVEGVGNNGLHNISHHGKNEDKIREFKLTNHWHVERVADLVAKMEMVDEGNGTLLDNTMLLFTPTMDGDAHDPTSIMPILIGGRNCDIGVGKFHQLEKEEDRRICNLHVALLNRMGVSAHSFGNSFHSFDAISG
ncbi:MAG: DUF1552 domain-containing protein [Opitutales bacterium]